MHVAQFLPARQTTNVLQLGELGVLRHPVAGRAIDLATVLKRVVVDVAAGIQRPHERRLLRPTWAQLVYVSTPRHHLPLCAAM